MEEILKELDELNQKIIKESMRRERDGKPFVALEVMSCYLQDARERGEWMHEIDQEGGQ